MDFNDYFMSAIPFHPSENYSAILPLADYLSRQAIAAGAKPLLVADVLTHFVKSVEVLGVLTLKNSLFDMGFDNAGMLKIAITPVVSLMLGGDNAAVRRATSQAVIDGLPTGIYRKPPNIGWRKSWAPADAAARSIHLAAVSLRDETGLPEAFSAPEFGFDAVYLRGSALDTSQPFGSYFAENIEFKLPYPAEGNTQTALEAALSLHDQVKDRFGQIDRVELQTTKFALDYACTKDPLTQLTNPAARDHDIRYVATIGLVFGTMKYDYYSDATAANPMVRDLLGRMTVGENQQFSADYADPSKRAVPSSLQVFFQDGTSTDAVTVEYPLGHPSRRKEAIPVLFEKLHRNVRSMFSAQDSDRVLAACQDYDTASAMPANAFVDLWLPTR